MKAHGFFDDHTLSHGRAAASPREIPICVAGWGERGSSAFSDFSSLTDPHRRGWFRDRVIDGVFAVVYVIGCAALVWAGSALR